LLIAVVMEIMLIY